MGPVVSEAQWNKVQGLIQTGIDEGATLAAGGTGRPDGLDEGYFVKPTVFADVTNDMTIAQEEIFGPVVSIIGYDPSSRRSRLRTTLSTAWPATSPVTRTRQSPSPSASAPG